jgi:hypothetical protein
MSNRRMLLALVTASAAMIALPADASANWGVDPSTATQRNKRGVHDHRCGERADDYMRRVQSLQRRIHQWNTRKLRTRLYKLSYCRPRVHNQMWHYRKRKRSHNSSNRQFQKRHNYRRKARHADDAICDNCALRLDQTYNDGRWSHRGTIQSRWRMSCVY